MGSWGAPEQTLQHAMRLFKLRAIHNNRATV